MTGTPDYIEQRIRCPIPADSHVVPCSTPVVAFGNARTATVATLGLNPSSLEFLDRNGLELVGSARRLATHQSLGVSDLANAPASVIAKVVQDCDSYFQHNPYRRWFDQLEQVLQACGASYYDGSACHLDLVQWATKPTWGKLQPRELQNRLMDADAEFIRQQLSNENIRLLLVNGRGVIDQLQQKLGATLDEVDPIVGLGRNATHLYCGTLFGRVSVIAWSTNLQSSFGVTSELRTAIANRAAQLVRDLGCIN